MVLVASGVAGGLQAHSGSQSRWVVCYSDKAHSEEFRGRNLIVLDSDSHPPLTFFPARGTTLLGYLSVGEVASSRAWFQAVKDEGLLSVENPNWAGSHYVDVRDQRWTARIVNQLIPEIRAKGFQGVFLDTLDDPVELERSDPARNRGMTSAATELVKAIHRAYPRMTIMMNRGFGLLPRVAGDINILLGESVYSTWDFKRRAYRLVDEREYQAQVLQLRDARKLNGALRICTLDYWDPADRDGIRRIYRIERANGFEPYVATIGLDQVIQEPR